MFDFLEEKIPGGAPGAAKNDQKRPEVDQNKRNERDFDQNDLNQAIQASLRTANNHTGNGRENGTGSGGNYL